MRVMLQHVAHARSGDKGNTANIAVIAYAPELYPCLKEQLTAQRLKAFYKGVITGSVERYAIDHLAAPILGESIAPSPGPIPFPARIGHDSGKIGPESDRSGPGRHGLGDVG